MLVGRDGELRRCRAALNSAAAGQASAIEVVGDAGIGKTALLSAAAVLDNRFRRLHVSGVPSEAVIAYAGVEALLRPLTGWIADLPVARQLPLRAALRIDGTAMPEPLSLVGSVLALLAVASAVDPLLLTVDDAQWLDEASRQVLGAVGRRLGGERIVMMMTSRDLTAPFDPDRTVRLATLNRGDAEELLRERRPGLTAAVVDELHRRTGGNPLWLLELADGLTPRQARGRSTLGESDHVPERAEAVHLSRIAAVTPSARDLLGVVAQVGRGELSTVHAAARELGLSAADSVAALHELVTVDLVDVTDVSVALSHPLLRQSIVTAGGPSGLQRTHLSLAAALADIDPDRALWHRAAAATGPDDGLSAELVDFAERLAETSQPDSARQAYEAAAAVTGQAASRAERLIRAAEVSLRGASGAATVRLLGQLLPLTFLDTRQRRRLKIVEAWAAVHAGHRARAGAALLDAVRDLPAAERAQIVAAAIASAIDGGDHATAREGVRLLAEADASLGDGALVGFVEFARPAVEYLTAGTRGELPATLRVGLSRWPATTHIPTLSAMRDTAMEAGELTTARSISLVIADAARASGDVYAIANAALAIAFCDHALANWNSAASRAFETTQLLEESFATVTVAEALLLLADIDASRGHSAACRATCARIRALAEQLSDPGFAVLADRREALLDIPSADPSAALRRLFAADRLFQRAELAHPYYSAVPDLVEVLVRLGRRDEAVAIAPRFLDLIGDGAPNPPRARALRVRALLVDGSGYDELFEESIAADLATGQAFHAARTMLTQGERQRRDGRRIAARYSLEQALDIFSRLEAAPWMNRARAELAATGSAPPTASRPAVVHSLTNQELQIAALVAEGHRNSEIAAALYLSTKTVEFHLTRAYRKAGVSNRTQLASLMSRPEAVDNPLRSTRIDRDRAAAAE